MNQGKIVLGAILLVIAIYVAVLMPTTDIMVKYVGGAILGIIGGAVLITGYRG